MAYTAPTISASGQTFADLQALGFAPFAAGVAAANSATVAQTTLVNQMMVSNQRIWPVARAIDIVSNYLYGRSVAISEFESQLYDINFAVAIVNQALAEVGELMDANPGTIVDKYSPLGTVTATRVFS